MTTIADVEQRKSNEMIGAELGYSLLSASPVICDIPGGPEHPVSHLRAHHVAGRAGCRMSGSTNGSAMQDRIPTSGYSILRLWQGENPTARSSLAH